MSAAGQIEVLRTNIREAELVPMNFGALGDGEVLLQIERFSVTTNNVTYAATGEQLGYWNFFPASRDGMGVVPVWGFARIIESKCEGIAPGERIYGFLPMASHAVFRPGKIDDRWFTDMADHRQKLPPVYNDYNRVAPKTDEGKDDLRALLQPLLVTSWLLFDFLQDNDWFGAEQIIVGSASSKTGLGLAKYLAEARPGGPKIVGLTSPANRGFVEGLGACDQTVTYDRIADDIDKVASVYVDMAGNAEVRSALHNHLGDLMKHSAAVGTSHWDKFAPTGDLPGAKPQFFFAPSQIVKRRQDWGADVVQQKIADAWQRLASSSSEWLTVEHSAGLDAALTTYRDLAAGKQSPNVGHVVVM